MLLFLLLYPHQTRKVLFQGGAQRVDIRLGVLSRQTDSQRAIRLVRRQTEGEKGFAWVMGMRRAGRAAGNEDPVGGQGVEHRLAFDMR